MHSEKRFFFFSVKHFMLKLIGLITHDLKGLNTVICRSLAFIRFVMRFRDKPTKCLQQTNTQSYPCCFSVQRWCYRYCRIVFTPITGVFVHSFMNKSLLEMLCQSCVGAEAYPKTTGCKAGIHPGQDAIPSQGVSDTHLPSQETQHGQ